MVTEPIQSTIASISRRLLADELNLVLSALLPTSEAIENRTTIFEMLQTYLQRIDSSAEMFTYGSTKLRVFLPKCDLDIGVCVPYSKQASLMLRFYNMLNIQSQLSSTTSSNHTPLQQVPNQKKN